MRARALLAGLILSGACAGGCGDADIPAPAPPPEMEQVQEPLAVQEGIDLCFRSLHDEVELCETAIDALRAATEEHPESARGFFILGMCALAAVAEGGNVSFAFLAEKSLAHAIELDPSNTRALGFLALVRLNIATALSNEEGRQQAIQDLITATETDSFNFFPLAIAFTKLDLDTGYPQMAVEEFEKNVALCSSPSADSRCVDSDLVRHRTPAFHMQLGDTYARVGDKEKAEQAYAGALGAHNVGSWPYASEAAAWAGELDARLALFADTDPTNDPDYFLSAARTCVGCHE